MQRRIVLFALCVAALVAAVAPQIARADGPTPSFSSPFSCGQTWYARTYAGHASNAIDWNMGGAGESDYGQPVRATAPGTARVLSDPKGYGTYVQVDHGNGWVSILAHLSGVAVRNGQRVETSTVVGYVGHSGDAEGTHLHHEQKHNGTRMPIVADGQVTRPSTDSRGAAYVSHNCGGANGSVTVALFSDAGRTSPIDAGDTPPATRIFARVTVPAGTPRGELIAAGPADFAAPDWTSRTRPAATVADASNGWNIDFSMLTPNREGDAREDFSIGPAVKFTVAVNLRHHLRWSVQQLSVTADRAGRIAMSKDGLLPGQVAWVHVVALNTGTFGWNQNVLLQTAEPVGHRSMFARNDWASSSEPGSATQAFVPVGQQTQFVFAIATPKKPGRYEDDFAPHLGGRRTDSAPVSLVVTVHSVAAAAATRLL